MAAVLHETRGTVTEHDRASYIALLTFKDFFSCKNIVDFLPGSVAPSLPAIEGDAAHCCLKCLGKAGHPNLVRSRPQAPGVFAGRKGNDVIGA